MSDWFVRNAEIIGFVGIIVFTVWTSWAIIRQIRLIWKHESVRSLSIVFSWYGFMYFGVRLAYGLETLNWALAFHGIARLLILFPIIVGIWKFHSYSRDDWIQFVGIMMLLPVALVLPNKDLPFLVLSLVGMGLFFHQPYTIFKNRDAGVVEVRVYAVGVVNMAFWVIHSWAVDDLIVLYPAIIGCFINALTLCLILKYPRQDTAAT